MAVASDQNRGYVNSILVSFWPTSVPTARLPESVPNEIVREYREAEICMSASAWRGAVALLRSVLEKAILANGYNKKDLFKKIEAAGVDGLITSARQQ